VRIVHRDRGERVHLVTEAQRPKSEDISYRQRRYLLSMGIRVVCFVLAIVLFENGAGWVAAIPVIAAIFIPYFAVVYANGGREPTRNRGFRPYQPNLPERHIPSAGKGRQDESKRDGNDSPQRDQNHKADGTPRDPAG
jgi:hypothetical protein